MDEDIQHMLAEVNREEQALQEQQRINNQIQQQSGTQTGGAASGRNHAYDANSTDGGKGRFQPDSDDRSICVLGLPPTVEVGDLGEFFSDCGQIAKITKVLDKKTNTFKGMAFIEFQAHEGAGRAVDTKNGQQVPGPNGPVTIRVSKKRSMFRPGMAPGAPGAAMAAGRGRGRGAGGFVPRGGGGAGAMGGGDVAAMAAAMMAMMLQTQQQMLASQGGAAGAAGGVGPGMMMMGRGGGMAPGGMMMGGMPPMMQGGAPMMRGGGGGGGGGFQAGGFRGRGGGGRGFGGGGGGGYQGPPQQPFQPGPPAGFMAGPNNNSGNNNNNGGSNQSGGAGGNPFG